MTNKYFGGVAVNYGVKEDVDDSLFEVVTSTASRVTARMDKLRVADAITEIFTLFKRCNKYIDETAPWVLAKDESKKERLSTVMYNLIDSILIGASLLEPFMPETAKKIADSLNAPLRTMDQVSTMGTYPSGNKVTDQPQILFARVDAEKMMEEVNALMESKKAAAKDASKETAEAEKEDEAVIDIEPKEEITYEDFSKMQFQVGEIISCEAVKKSKKLLCSQVKIGSQVKQIVSGGRDYEVTVDFDDFGTKKMFASFAKLQKL